MPAAHVLLHYPGWFRGRHVRGLQRDLSGACKRFFCASRLPGRKPVGCEAGDPMRFRRELVYDAVALGTVRRARASRCDALITARVCKKEKK